MALSLDRVLTKQAAQVVLHRTLKHREKVYCVAFSPDGRYLVSGSVSRHLHLWDLEKAESEPVTFSGHTKFVWSVSFSPDGKTIASASGDGCLFLRDVKSGSHYRIMESHYSRVQAYYGSAFSPDGRYLAAACMDGDIHLWSTLNRYPARRLRGHKGAVYGVSFSADSRFLASGGDDETIRVWDVSARQEVNVLVRPGCRVTNIIFSADGNWLAYASANTQIYLSNLGTGEVRCLSGHQGVVWNVEFSPDSRFLISASNDQMVIIWEVKSGLNINVLSGHRGAVNSVAFAPDGSFAASASDDKTVRIWDLQHLKERPEAYLRLVEKQPDRLNQTDSADFFAETQRSVFNCLLNSEELLPENFVSIYRQMLDLLPNLSLEKSGGGHTYTVGGYHGLSHKGELESLLSGEYLYPESLFLHRLCNREALYYGREGGVRKRHRLVYILTQSGLEMSGSCDLIARALTLALVEKLALAPVDLRHSFIGSSLTESLDPALSDGARRLVSFKEHKPLDWISVLKDVVAQMKCWQNDYVEIEAIWIVEPHVASDWELESCESALQLRSVGRQQAWFITPAPDSPTCTCKSHTLFTQCKYLNDILPQSWSWGGSNGNQS
ncbi:WD40 repeat domain-containing protein [bacterium]|nr:WD40 repeat domain-containing protein [bacterium]